MWGPARLVTLLAVAAATHAQGAVAAASDRFVPANPEFVVADVRRAQPDEELRELLAASRADSRSQAVQLALARAYIARARTLREPGFFGRAEAVLARIAAQPDASAPARRLYAQVLQYRHDFPAAEALLDAILSEAPRDSDARQLRASIRLVRGDFAGARGDCARIAAEGAAGAQIGFTCLAEALAGSGQMERALALLTSAPVEQDSTDFESQAYLLATRAELRERNGELAVAIVDYREALRLAPRDDSIRAAFADALAATGDVDEAREVLEIDKPSLALLVRSAALSAGARRVEFSARATAWLTLEAARGDAIHHREEALLALLNDNPEEALAAAARNFETQKELPDVRVLARAARAARDAKTSQMLRNWLKETGYRDSVTEGILGSGVRS
jgi:thioredoxin-like negative regulator of GroEL